MITGSLVFLVFSQLLQWFVLIWRNRIFHVIAKSFKENMEETAAMIKLCEGLIRESKEMGITIRQMQQEFHPEFFK